MVLVMVHEKTEVVCISVEVYTYFLAAIIYCPFQAGSFFVGIALFNVCNCRVSTTNVVSFSAEVFGVVCTT